MASSTNETPSAARAVVIPLLAAFALSFTFLTLPRYPHLLDDALSWNAVLHLAHEKGWQFGDDIIFTYGPLGFLVSRYYFPGGEGVRLTADLGLCFATALSVCLLAWRLGRWRGALLAVVFTLCCANLDPRADLLLYTSLLSWAALCLSEKGRALPAWACMLLLTAAYGCLVKTTFLFFAAFTVLAMFAALLLRGQARQGTGLLLGFPAALLAGWTLAGQQIDGLARYLAGAWAFSRDYDAAMGVEGLSALRFRGFLLMACTLITVVVRTWPVRKENGHRITWTVLIALAWLTGATLLVAKYGLVRADLYHAGVLFGLAPIIALTAQSFPGGPRALRPVADGFALAACLVAAATIQAWFVSSFPAFLLQPFRAIPSNLAALVRPREYRAQQLTDLESLQPTAALPQTRNTVGRSTVDVFGHDQSYALLNGLNYQPRPVFQSYIAYNSMLTRWNEEMYLSKEAPEYVLFNLAPIDRRFPPLEDSAVLRALLLNYRFVSSEGPFLLLKSRSHDIPKLELMRAGTLRANERLDLSKLTQTNLWIELDARPTLLGRLRQFFYKPSKLWLRVWPAPSEARPVAYPAPAPMLGAGFLASPLLLSRDDVLHFYEEKPAVHLQGFALDPGEKGGRYWQQPFAYRIYILENRLAQGSH